MNFSLLAILLAGSAQEATEKLDTNHVLQYTAVGIVFTALGIWLVVKMVLSSRNREKGGGGCCGCALAESCNSRKLKESKRL